MKTSRVARRRTPGVASCLAVSCLAVILSLFGASPASVAQKDGRRAASGVENSIIFKVSRGADASAAIIEPVVLVDGRGRFVEPPGGTPQLREKYFGVGRKYRVLFGGGAAGSLTVKDSSAGECLPDGAGVELQTSAGVGGNVMALATDSPTLGRGQSARRAPTADEHAAAETLAKQAFRKNGVRAVAERTLHTVNLTATDLDRDGKFELVGTFGVVSGKNARDTLFLIAEPRARGGWRAGLAKHERIRAGEMMDGSLINEVGRSGLLTELFIDALDLDAATPDEVLTVANSFEGSHYAVYQKRRGAWRNVYNYYAYRCGY